MTKEVLVEKIKFLNMISEKISNSGEKFLFERFKEHQEKFKDSEFDYWRGAHCQVDDEFGSRETKQIEFNYKMRQKDPGFIPVGPDRDVFAKTKHPEIMTSIMTYIFSVEEMNDNQKEDWYFCTALIRDDIAEVAAQKCNELLNKKEFDQNGSKFALKVIEDVISCFYDWIGEIDSLTNVEDSPQEQNKQINHKH